MGQGDEEKKKKDLSTTEIRSWVEDILNRFATEDFFYVVVETKVIVLVGHLETKEMRQLFRKNYDLLVDLIRNPKVSVFVDNGAFVEPLDILFLQEITNTKI